MLTRLGSCSLPDMKSLMPDWNESSMAEQGYAVVEKLGIAGVEAARLHPRKIKSG